MRKKPFLILLTCIYFFSDLYAQNGNSSLNFDPAVIKNGYYNDGIYSNINQFLTNTPEKIAPIRLDYPGISQRLMCLDIRTNKFVSYTKQHWGVCINNQVYLKHAGKYILIQPIGRFSFFNNTRYGLGGKGVPFNSSPIRITVITSTKKEFIIDFKTNQRYKLSPYNVQKILMSEDKDLYNEYLKTEHRKYFMKEFVLKLNEKYSK